MIFYFTGTGNSLYAAKSLLNDGEELVNMAENRSTLKSYDLKGERVGFVFPVYYYTLGDVVAEFVDNLDLRGAGYAFAVITCGGSIGGSGALLRERLQKRGVELDAVFSVVMTDNAMLYYNISDSKKAEKELAKADRALSEIKNQIRNRDCTDFGSSVIAKVSRAMYHAAASTKKYRVTEKCVSCGKCAANCPDKAIKMENGRPTWVKSKCTLCMACINRCPVGAIEYGKRTEGRNRFENKKAFE